MHTPLSGSDQTTIKTELDLCTHQTTPWVGLLGWWNYGCAAMQQACGKQTTHAYILVHANWKRTAYIGHPLAFDALARHEVYYGGTM